MKRLFFLIAFLLMYYSHLNAQTTPDSGWITIGLTVDRNPLYSVKFLDNQVGWVSGQNGIINKTTDSGKTWYLQESNTEATLFSLFLFDENSLIVVGDSGIILKTIDGGNNWSKLSSNTNKTLHSVYFVDTNTGWAVGDSGTILHTTNGGILWFLQTPDTITNLLSVHFINHNTGYIAGDKGRGYKTNNGGTDWGSHYFGYDYMFNCITFINEDTGWVFSSDREIFITTDKGENWNKQTGVGNYQRIYSSSFIGKVGYAVGNYGTIINTTNGGVNWQRQYITGNLWFSIPLLSVHFIDLYRGWAVGDAGIILGTKDGGGIFITSTISASATAGSQTLEVFSNAGFSIGDNIIINPGGANEEINIISGFGSILLSSLLQFDHQIGELIVKLSPTAVDDRYEPIPDEFILNQNYPNPFNPSTKISWQSPVGSWQTLKVFDVLGNEIATLVDEYYEAGPHSTFYIVNSTLPSGVYFYQIRAEDYFETKKMMLLK